MDPDTIQKEVEEWVQDGIITDEQAVEILSRYERADSRRSRVVVALSLVGAALVFVGVTLFLGTNWEDLPRLIRALVLVAGPGLAYAGGAAAYSRDAPRIGLALCLLGAALVGPAMFLFDDLFAFELAHEWLLLAWTAVALPTGHALDSRAGTGIGLLVLAALVATLAESAEPVPVIGLLGIGLFALGHSRSGPVPWTYRLGGVALTLGALLVLTMLEGRFARFALELTAPLVAGLAGALSGVGWLRYVGKRTESGWAGAAFVALCGAVAAATLAPETVPALVAFGGTHLAALGALIATGYLGYRTNSPTLIDLAALGALGQTLSFVAATVIDGLSGSVALVVAGLVLLTVGVGIERGRRSLQTRL